MGFLLVAEGLLAAYLPPSGRLSVLGRQQLQTETTINRSFASPRQAKLENGQQHASRNTSLVQRRLAVNPFGRWLFALCVGKTPFFRLAFIKC
jgi:hypothetical protein